MSEIPTESPSSKIENPYIPKNEIKNQRNEIFGILDNKEYPEKTKKGVDFVFEENPELDNIGTKEQYSKYLDTIFPDSKVKDILYNRSSQKIEAFDKSKTKEMNGNRFYFSTFNTGRYGQYVKMVILNIQNLATPYNDNFMDDVNKKHPEYSKGKSEFFHLPSQIYVNANKYEYDGVFAYEGTNDDE